LSDLPGIFEYRLVAVQYDLNYIDIVGYINLSMTNEELPGVEEFYGKASIEIKKGDTYEAQYGAAIVYGITIPCNAENEELTTEFIELLLSAAGKQVMEVENGQPMLDPPICHHPKNLPESLQDLFD
jgi:ABC-type molybdate transport system substrate-binding protein